ncbi:uncharacterized protein HMPREF1541_07974 [Cyphellophora europaea CBS 101466]|uniref:Fungal N-terminal domain-containing protein n=1 Tax=Cyphellophora europaea (strain CBS 101466) TaxID=1220924 RepID=W2RKJ0_CYPE1|nr:uncharacterized protein HMPREF1541_07974 [Cyphellophora europaea CBS 101466]ETN36986.1 hypothetical protein HMPREF1541_07974 [Cyphellophora europaea CBS 101466]
MPRPRDNLSPPDNESTADLRRRLLDSLAYICDSEKGGDTMTAIFVSSPPLTYHLARNKKPSDPGEVLAFLKSVLNQLENVDEHDRDRSQSLLAECIQFSEKRIKAYKRMLQIRLKICFELAAGTEIRQRLQKIAQVLEESAESYVDLCRRCFAMVKSQDMSIITAQAIRSEDYGHGRNPFAELRHFVGRIGSHVQVVKVLLVAARRLPILFKDFEIEIVTGPTSPAPIPRARNQLTLSGIANRLASNDGELTKEVQGRLELLNQAMDLEQTIRKEYSEKGQKPQIHAELILLEHYYRNREILQFYDSDRYIGASKPACYCCSLYFREHPGDLAQPASHQKIYLNWVPPMSASDAQEQNSESAIHERAMLNRMVKSIRTTAIEQLRQQTGPSKRMRQFDSITWESLPRGLDPAILDAVSLGKPPDTVPKAKGRKNPKKAETGISELLTEKMSISDGDDTDDEGGVALVTR